MDLVLELVLVHISEATHSQHIFLVTYFLPQLLDFFLTAFINLDVDLPLNICKVYDATDLVLQCFDVDFVPLISFINNTLHISSLKFGDLFCINKLILKEFKAFSKLPLLFNERKACDLARAHPSLSNLDTFFESLVFF